RSIRIAVTIARYAPLPYNNTSNRSRSLVGAVLGLHNASRSRRAHRRFGLHLLRNYFKPLQPAIHLAERRRNLSQDWHGGIHDRPILRYTAPFAMRLVSHRDCRPDEHATSRQRQPNQQLLPTKLLHNDSFRLLTLPSWRYRTLVASRPSRSWLRRRPS